MSLVQTFLLNAARLYWVILPTAQNEGDAVKRLMLSQVSIQVSQQK